MFISLQEIAAKSCLNHILSSLLTLLILLPPIKTQKNMSKQVRFYLVTQLVWNSSCITLKLHPRYLRYKHILDNEVRYAPYLEEKWMWPQLEYFWRFFLIKVDNRLNKRTQKQTDTDDMYGPTAKFYQIGTATFNISSPCLSPSSLSTETNCLWIIYLHFQTNRMMKTQQLSGNFLLVTKHLCYLVSLRQL